MISHKAYVKNPSSGHKVEKHHSEGNNVRRALDTKGKTAMVPKYWGKATSPKNKKNADICDVITACGCQGACISKKAERLILFVGSILIPDISYFPLPFIISYFSTVCTVLVHIRIARLTVLLLIPILMLH